MQASAQNIVELENRFWKSMVDEDTDTALAILAEPALMVSGHGMMKFDHAGYRKMAEHGTKVLKDFEMSDVEVVFPTDDVAVMTYKVTQTMAPRDKPGATTEQMADSSTWVRKDGQWLCVMHTETPVAN